MRSCLRIPQGLKEETGSRGHESRGFAEKNTLFSTPRERNRHPRIDRARHFHTGRQKTALLCRTELKGKEKENNPRLQRKALFYSAGNIFLSNPARSPGRKEVGRFLFYQTGLTKRGRTITRPEHKKNKNPVRFGEK